MPFQRSFDPEEDVVIKAIKDFNGNIAAVCKELKTTRGTLVRWLTYHPNVQQTLADAREEMLDMAESSLYRRVLAGDAWAVCCVAGTLVSDALGIPQPIEHYDSGNVVLTMQGRVQRVIGVSSRWYTGDVIAIEVSGLPRKLVVTPEHPVYAMLRRGSQQTPRNRPLETATFCEAELLRVGDYVHTPIPNIDYRSMLDAPTAYILGIYAAEGRAFKLDEPKFPHISPDRGGYVEFSLHATKDAYLQGQITNYAHTHLNDAPIYHRQHSQTDQCSMFYLSHRPFARLCAEHVGVGSSHKELSADLMYAEPEIQLAFLAGYLRGDGSISGRADDSRAANITVTTASEALAYQLQYMLSRVGVVAALKFGWNNGGPTNRKACLPKWTLYIRPRECIKLKDVLNYQFAARDNKPGLRRMFNDGVYGRIRSITRMPYDGYVYNLQIENDETYVAEMMSVHNCFFLKTQGRKRGYIERAETFNLKIDLNELSRDQLERIAAGEHPSLVLGAAAGQSPEGTGATDPLTIEGTSTLGPATEASE